MFKESAFSQGYGVPGIIDDSCFRLILLNSLFYEQNIIFSTQGRDFYCLLRMFLTQKDQDCLVNLILCEKPLLCS